MSKDKLGTKRTCPNCDGKFYDLCKNPIICPLCKSEFKIEDIIKKRGDSKISAKDLDIDNENDSADIVSDIIVDNDLIEDTSDLGGDDDMSEVMDHIESDEDDN